MIILLAATDRPASRAGQRRPCAQRNSVRMAAGEVQSATEFVERLKENELLEHPEELLQRPLHEARGAEEPRTVVRETRRLQAQLNVWIRIRQESMDRLVKSVARGRSATARPGAPSHPARGARARNDTTLTRQTDFLTPGTGIGMPASTNGRYWARRSNRACSEVFSGV
jgi:hypothetical protein